MPKRKRQPPKQGHPFGLLQIGALCLFAGPFSYLLQQQFWPLGPLVSARRPAGLRGRC